MIGWVDGGRSCARAIGRNVSQNAADGTLIAAMLLNCFAEVESRGVDANQASVFNAAAKTHQCRAWIGERDVHA